jgi:cold shock CspA family protein
MRTHGILTTWHDDRGFGFIEPAAGGGEIFVHVSAFPRDGMRPRIGELVSFDIEVRGDGKKRAVRVMRPGSSARRHARPPSAMSRQSPLVTMAGLLALVAIGCYGYSQLATNRSAPPAPATRAIPAVSMQDFSCDGRTRCSQMTSCAEATFFVKQCPGTQMDGDGDGEPCESQWCSGRRAD